MVSLREPLGKLNCFPRRSKRGNKAPKKEEAHERPCNRLTGELNVPAPSGPFPFLRLPRELRDRVYRDLLTRDEHREIWIRYSVHRELWWDATPYCKCHGRGGYNPAAEKLTLGLLKFNKQIYAEALETLYGRNRIWVDATPRKSLEFLSRLPPTARYRIQYLKLWLDSYIIEKGESPMLVFSKLSDSEKAMRYRQELLLPWQDICSFMTENLPSLHTLCVTRTSPLPFVEWGPHHAEPMWAYFYHQGWVEAIRNIQSLSNLEVELRVNFEGPRPLTLDGCNELRRICDRESGFREQSVEWIYTFFEADDIYPSVWPAAMLMIHLSRITTDHELFPPSTPDEEERNERTLPLLPAFVQKHTYADATYINVCTMGTGGPPRSPDNNR
jgi:hypothetical protein